MTVREKYPTAHYDPDPECRFCKGRGERTIKPKTPDEEPFDTCCICIFVGGPREDREEIARALGNAAKKALADLRAGRF